MADSTTGRERNGSDTRGSAPEPSRDCRPASLAALKLPFANYGPLMSYLLDAETALVRDVRKCGTAP